MSFREKFAIRDNRVEPVTVDDLDFSHDENGRVYFHFEDGTKKFCSWKNEHNILFESYKSAAIELALRRGVHCSIYSAKKFYIWDAVFNLYFSGFHKSVFLENDCSVIVDVPDFVSMHEAYCFRSFDGANNIYIKIKDVCPNTVIVGTKDI